MLKPLAALLLALPAHAGPVAQWGASTAVLAPCRDADACVVVINFATEERVHDGRE